MSKDYIHGKPLYYNTVMSLGGQALGLWSRRMKAVRRRSKAIPIIPGALEPLADITRLQCSRSTTIPAMLVCTGTVKNPNWDAFTAYVQGLQGQLGNGAGLRFLSEHINSPSFAAVKRHALTRFPAAKWVEYNAVHTSATAQPTLPRIAFDKAAVVVALDSDFLGLDDTSRPSCERVFSRTQDYGRREPGHEPLVFGGAYVHGHWRCG